VVGDDDGAGIILLNKVDGPDDGRALVYFK
jgi:hypothetical protein